MEWVKQVEQVPLFCLV